MIKNKRQLLHAEKRLAEIESEIANIRAQRSDNEEIFTAPYEIEASKLRSDIAEYKELIKSSLSEAVAGILKKPHLLDDVGELLTKLRIAEGISQSEMAERLGWRQSNLSRFENANYGSQSVAKIIEFADELGAWLYVVPFLEELDSEDRFIIEKRDVGQLIRRIIHRTDSQPDISVKPNLIGQDLTSNIIKQGDSPELPHIILLASHSSMATTTDKPSINPFAVNIFSDAGLSSV